MHSNAMIIYICMSRHAEYISDIANIRHAITGIEVAHVSKHCIHFEIKLTGYSASGGVPLDPCV